MKIEIYFMARSSKANYEFLSLDKIYYCVYISKYLIKNLSVGRSKCASRHLNEAISLIIGLLCLITYITRYGE